MDGRATFKFKVMSIKNNGKIHSKRTPILEAIQLKKLTASDIRYSILGFWPIPVVARCKARVCGRSLAGNAGSNPTDVVDVCLL
jgi:hypothetical protein